MTSGVGRGLAGAGRMHGKVGTYASGCRCDPCLAAARVWRRERYIANHEEAKANLRAGYARNRLARVNARMSATYGISVAERDAIRDAQDGVCAVCNEPPGARVLSVDHDHSTGQIRGLLCSRCNSALGLLKDDEQRIESLLAYLRRSKELRLVS